MLEYNNDTKIYKISYLLMADTVERLDMILLELRHLQRNIIYSMREPGFNAPLRFEEDFLWGQGWEKIFRECDTTEREDEVIAQNVPLFPSPEDSSVFIGTDQDARENPDEPETLRDKNRNHIDGNLKGLLDHLWNKTEWRVSYGRHYDNLRGTQLLKRLIARDKFKFCKFALTHAGIVAGRHPETVNQDAQDALSRFIILRSAVHSRCNQYLERIMEYQSLFSKVLDIGVKEFPAPSTERRREIGIYMNFLDERVKSVREETEHLIRYLQISDSDKKDEKRIILHSWKHHFTAQHQFQEDSIGRSLRKNQCDLHHITTSYWMPERMDLQPMIAHETAHLVLHQYFDNLSDIFLQHSPTDFVALQRALLRVLGEYDRILGIGRLSPAHKPRFLIREISCDLLAASVKGFSYLYALLLETVGTGLERYLLHGNFEAGIDFSDLIDLDMIYSLAGTGGHPLTMRRDWWLRLKLVIFWLKRVHHWQPSGLDIILLEGTDSLLDNLLVFFDRITLSPEDKKGELWKALFGRLCDEIEISPAVSAVRQWRVERSCASESKKYPSEEQDPFPRSVLRLPEELSKTLKEIQMGLKIQKGKALAAYVKDDKGNPTETCTYKKMTDCFDRAYLIKHPFEYQKHEVIFSSYSGHRHSWDNKVFHGHLFNIPWICAMTRTIDLFGYDKNIKQRYPVSELRDNWLDDDFYKAEPQQTTLSILSEDNVLGRELYSLALEFYIFAAEDPIDRLVHVRHLIMTHKETRDELDQKIVEGWENKIKNDGILTGKNITHWQKQRMAEELIGEILGKLPHEEKYLPLINYLTIHQKERKSDVLKEIINAITSVHPDKKCRLQGVVVEGGDRDNDNGVLRCFRMILVSRYTVGGFYAMQSDEQYDAFTDKHFTPVQLLDGDTTYWTAEKNVRKGCDVYPFNKMKYCNVLGRYDALSFTRTRPLCRCSLPYFDVKKRDNSYGFASLLTRREFGIRIDLNNEQRRCIDHLNREKNCSDECYGLIGAVSVTLKRRSLRIPFLARLLASVQEGDDIGGISKEKRLTERCRLKKEQDTVLLLDGSVDFLICFCEKRTKDTSETELSDTRIKRVGDIIDAAYWLYQDFMIERTETILDAIVLDDVVRHMIDKKSPDAHSYSIECALRFFEDQFLDDSVEIFRNDLFGRIREKSGPFKDDPSSPLLFVMAELTPGRTDMCLRFFNEDFIDKDNFMNANADTKNKAKWCFKLENDKSNSFRKQLVELLEP